jgi:hypothetical protein
VSLRRKIISTVIRRGGGLAGEDCPTAKGTVRAPMEKRLAEDVAALSRSASFTRLARDTRG